MIRFDRFDVVGDGDFLCRVGRAGAHLERNQCILS